MNNDTDTPIEREKLHADAKLPPPAPSDFIDSLVAHLRMFLSNAAPVNIDADPTRTAKLQKLATLLYDPNHARTVTEAKDTWTCFWTGYAAILRDEASRLTADAWLDRCVTHLRTSLSPGNSSNPATRKRLAGAPAAAVEIPSHEQMPEVKAEAVVNDLHDKTLEIWQRVMVPWFHAKNHTPRTPSWTALKLVLDLLSVHQSDISSTSDLLDWFGVMLSFELEGWADGGFLDHGVVDVRVNRITSSGAWLYIHRAYQRLFAQMERPCDPTSVEATAPSTLMNLRLLILREMEDSALLWMQSSKDVPLQNVLDTALAYAVQKVAAPLAQQLSSAPGWGLPDLRQHMDRLRNCAVALGFKFTFNFDALRIYVS